MKKINCLILERKIDVKDCKPLPHSSNCQICPQKDRIKPNLPKTILKPKPKPKREKPPETANEPVRTKARSFYDHPTSIAGLQEAFKEHYEENNNPLHLMLAFNHAVEHGTVIPQWVQSRIYQAFDFYMRNNNSSLDVLLGCKKRGPRTVKERFETRGRNVELMTTMDALVRQGMHVEDAAIIAHEYVHKQGNYSPNPEKVRQMYYSGWKKRLQGITQYPPLWDFLRSVPDAIKGKYPEIFNKII